MDKYRVGIVIPALNESLTITAVVEAVGKYGVPIVVDDGSTDNTAELALRSGAVVVMHEKNYGYDAALNSGFKKAEELGKKIIITVDADGQHDPSLIQEFIDAIDSGSDIVVGIRSKQQRFLEYLFAWYAVLRFGIKDPLCGMKAYRTTVYKELGYFDSYGSIGTELMIFAVKKGYRLEQIAFDLQDRIDKPRFGKMLSGNYKIMRAMILSI
jgi:glycosyltransferase involved in cell wall biosynthesis